MEEKEKKLLRYIELAAKDARGGCDNECQEEKTSLLSELHLTHEQAVVAGKNLMERLS